MSFLPDIPVLDGALVRLEPLSMRHAADLMIAAEEDRDAYRFTRVPRAPEMAEYLAGHFELADRGRLVPFAQIRMADGRAVGCTAYWEPRFWPARPDLCAVEIGWTWLAASAQRTGINTEAKLLLFEYGFENLSVVRVNLKTDARNERSRLAIERLGARFEGILRSYSPSHAPGESGLLRDSAMFSLLAPEWPAVKAALRHRLAGAAATSGTTAGPRSPAEPRGTAGPPSPAEPRSAS